MGAIALPHIYKYLYPTSVGPLGKALGLQLATSGGTEAHPYFFEGQIQQPNVVADTLLTLSKIVRTHFFLPRPVILDPVVTASENVLRFEGFSGCCGVYARVDMRSETFDTEITGQGTTNVDFNNSMCAGLTRLRQEKTARIAVGTDEVMLDVAGQQLVEKKVKLPVRWIKCFSEVQAYQRKLQKRLEIRGPEVMRFIRSLPRGGNRNRPAWIVKSGRGLRLSQRESNDGVLLAGTDRLKVLERISATAKQLTVWGDASGVSAWQFEFRTARFLVVLSPELFRGFSGEGQVLETLSANKRDAAVGIVQKCLQWQSQIDSAKLAKSCKVDVGVIEDSLAVLGSRGLVGYDVADGTYFHRELPFDLTQVEKLQPRLKNARKLLAEKKIRLYQQLSDDVAEYWVKSSDVEHLVRLGVDEDSCTCPWFSKYRGTRGPCKHVLAARLYVDAGEE